MADDSVPRVVCEGELAYEDIPTRVGIAPLLPVAMVWEGRCEVYVPASLTRPEEDGLLGWIADYAGRYGLAVHVWRVRCQPWQRLSG